MTTWGTSYFPTRNAAVRYYRSQGHDDARTTVVLQLDEGSIHIGRPPLKPGERLVLMDNGMRYGIEVPDTASSLEEARARVKGATDAE